jgi:hypothetical protein
MHPVLAHAHRTRWYLGAWGVTGLLLGVIIRVVVGGSWFGAVAFGLPMGIVAGSLSLSAWYVCRALPLARTPAPRLIVTAILAALVTASVWASLGDAEWRAVTRLDLVPPGAAPGLVPVLLVFGGLTYLLTVTVHYVWQTFEDSVASARRALESEVAHRDAELRALRAQIDPHFLFNSLNSVAGLIGTQPAQARLMCRRIGDFLRDSLRLGQSPRISLDRELALARQYLEVEQVRFGSRLRVRVESGDQLGLAAIPPLLLQPLVENAVRHGIATRLDGGEIAVVGRRTGDRVLVVVENPFDADRARRGTGFGQQLVRRRLEASYAGRATMTVESSRERFRVTLTLPFEETT